MLDLPAELLQGIAPVYWPDFCFGVCVDCARFSAGDGGTGGEQKKKQQQKKKGNEVEVFEERCRNHLNNSLQPIHYLANRIQNCMHYIGS